MPAMTRGPLPPGTYWRRRLFVSLLATGIVFVAATALGLGGDGAGDGAGGEQAARQAGAASTTAPTPTAEPSASGQPTEQQGKKGQKKRKRLATPSGRCAPQDIAVTPTTKRAVAGQPIEITLDLQTRTNPACHWEVDARRVAVRISGDGGEVWSTRHCREGIPAREVVVRRAVPTEVVLTWDARRSDDGCPKATEWVLPGEYDVTAAALGGEPTQRSLRLYAPGAMPTERELRAEVRTGNALERLERRQAAEREE